MPNQNINFNMRQQNSFSTAFKFWWKILIQFGIEIVVYRMKWNVCEEKKNFYKCKKRIPRALENPIIKPNSKSTAAIKKILVSMHRVRIHWALPFFKHEHMTLFCCFFICFLKCFVVSIQFHWIQNNCTSCYMYFV